MAYQQQQGYNAYGPPPPQGGYYQQQPGGGGYYQQQQQPMYVQQQPRSGGNDSCLMGCLAALCVCCTLDMLLSQIYLLPVLLFSSSLFVVSLFC